MHEDLPSQAMLRIVQVITATATATTTNAAPATAMATAQARGTAATIFAIERSASGLHAWRAQLDVKCKTDLVPKHV